VFILDDLDSAVNSAPWINGDMRSGLTWFNEIGEQLWMVEECADVTRETDSGEEA